MNPFDRRKQEILERLQREAGAAAGRRQALRAAGAAACTGAALIAVVAVLTQSPASPRAAPRVAEQASPTPLSSKLDARIVSRRADLSDYSMTDAELLSALEAADEPIGVIWAPGSPQVVSLAPRDPERGGR